MPVVIWVAIEDNDGLFPPPHHEVLIVVVRVLPVVADEAFVGFVESPDVVYTPGRP